jgi:hypothetical protein
MATSNSATTVISAPSRRLGWALLVLGLSWASPARAADLSWKGLDWNVTDGGMAGVADGAAANVTVDANDWLHLTLTKNGSTWTASELFTTQKLGFVSIGGKSRDRSTRSTRTTCSAYFRTAPLRVSAGTARTRSTSNFRAGGSSTPRTPTSPTTPLRAT